MPLISSNDRFKKLARFLSLCLLFLAALPISIFSQEKGDQEKTLEKQIQITEEILVIGKAPKELPVSTVTRLDFTRIDRHKPRDLSEVIKYAPGVMVTFGDKDVYSLKLRGMDARRIALLVDGIPVYEPYFSTFDLKTVAAAGMDSIQITKGPSSVLYGPNTLGGIVNIITRRPGPDPFLSFRGSYGAQNTRSLGLDAAFQWKPIAFAGTVDFQDSRGFFYPDETGETNKRTNSDYQRFNLNAKLYYTPSSRTEIMINGGIYQSEYGMPAALFIQKSRYWRFKNWDRYTLNAGGLTAIGERSTLRFRTYFVQYRNTLDQFYDAAMTLRQFESTYDNSVFGLFALGDFFLSSAHSLKLSLNYQKDIARTRDDAGLPWNKYNQGTFSIGLEDHYSISERWKLIGGLSLDYLDKFRGENKFKLNPLAGIKFSPGDYLDLHLSFSMKSRFPSMRSLYSESSGNPDLLSETGSNWEIGLTYNKGFLLTGAAFLYSFRDMIDTVRLPDGTRRYFNIGKAYINGFEMQIQKSFSGLELVLNYTYLDHNNQSDNRPLDALPHHNVNFELSVFPFRKFRASLFGLAASSSSWYDYSANTLLNIPSYFSLDALLDLDFKELDIFLKISNVLDHYFYTEPGFPLRGRYIELGVKINIFRQRP
ncbi:MAG: TonB-dependent receptor [Candidatus Aminicenantales bacterium]